MIDTRLPRAEKTCANSDAMKPLPRITRCSGRAGSRMMSSLVTYGTPPRVTSSGTTGRDPAAITTWSAVITSPVPVRIVRGPVKVAYPEYSVVLGFSSRR